MNTGNINSPGFTDARSIRLVLNGQNSSHNYQRLSDWKILITAGRLFQVKAHYPIEQLIASTASKRQAPNATRSFATGVELLNQHLAFDHGRLATIR